MTAVTRLLKLLAGGLAFGVYVWFAAVRNVPRARARKRRPRALRNRP